MSLKVNIFLRKTGFSLIELLITISILSVAMSVAFKMANIMSNAEQSIKLKTETASYLVNSAILLQLGYDHTQTLGILPQEELPITPSGPIFSPDLLKNHLLHVTEVTEGGANSTNTFLGTYFNSNVAQVVTSDVLSNRGTPDGVTLTGRTDIINNNISNHPFHDVFLGNPLINSYIRQYVPTVIFKTPILDQNKKLVSNSLDSGVSTAWRDTFGKDGTRTSAASMRVFQVRKD